MSNTISNQIKKYKIVFCGELQNGQDLYTVKIRLTSLLKVPLQVVGKLFLGKPVLLRTDLTSDMAQSFKSSIENTGILCYLYPVSENINVPVSNPLTSLPEKNTDSQPPASFRPPLPPPSWIRNSQNVIPFLIGVIILAIVFFSIPSRSNVSSAAQDPSDSWNTSKANSRNSPSVLKSTSSKGLLSDKLKRFDDPKHYYSISLPEGYRNINKSSGIRSKVTFIYSDDISVSILASPVIKRWDPKPKMDQKVLGIRQGRAGNLSQYKLTHYGLINFNGMEGYELILTKGSDIMYSYSFITPKDIGVAISIVTFRKYQQENHDILKSAIQSNLKFY